MKFSVQLLAVLLSVDHAFSNVQKLLVLILFMEADCFELKSLFVLFKSMNTHPRLFTVVNQFDL